MYDTRRVNETPAILLQRESMRELVNDAQRIATLPLLDGQYVELVIPGYGDQQSILRITHAAYDITACIADMDDIHAAPHGFKVWE